MNKLTYPATLLAIACSIELTSASETNGIAWMQAGRFAVANANCTLLLAGAVMAAGAADSKPELPEDRALEQLATRDAFEAAQKLWAASAAAPLPARMLELAATLVASEDPFAAGLAEWALARRVAADNLGQDIQWPRENPPGWFQAWRHAVETRTLELDYARQGIALGLGRDSAGMVASAHQCLERARVAVVDLARDDATVVEGQGARRRWAGAQQRVEELERAVASAPRDVAQHRQLWLKVRLALREVVLHRAEIDFSRILYVRAYNGHSLRNITGSQYPWTHKPGGDVVAQDGLAPDAPTKALIRGRLGPGHVHGMDLSWDADRVIAGFAKQPHWPPKGNTQNGFDSYTLRKDQPPTQLYEIRLDSGEIQQITDHPVWSDFEPTYCASGAIAFASDRSGRSSECGSFAADHTVINLYVVDPETRLVRRLSDNKDIDRYPHALADGTIGYTRWEYQERHFMEVHSIWRIRPDGTMADAVFKQHLGAPLSLRDVRSVPGGPLLVAVAAGHHTLAQGPVVVVDPRQGINRASALGIVTPNVRPQEGPMAGTPVPPGGVRDGGGLYQTPWALSDRAFLVSYTYDGVAGREGTFALYLIDVYGNKELLHRDALLSCAYPMPLKKRPRPPVLPDSADPTKKYAVCQISDVYEGWDGVPRGAVKYLRISQRVGWPLDDKIGAMRWIPGEAYQTHYGFWSWAPARVLGTVKVEADGSAHFRVPANEAVYFQALDEKRLELRRMRSHVTFQPGEVRSCRGCHETQTQAPAPAVAGALALRREAEIPTPPPWGNRRLLGYEWLVQPVLDQQCVRCHSPESPGGGLDFSGQRREDDFLQSFHTIFPRSSGKGDGPSSMWVAVSNRFSGASVSQTMQFGSHKSRFITVLLEDDLHRREVKLNDQQWEALVTWVDANAPYYDMFFNKRPADGKPVREIRLEFPDPFAN